MRQMKATLLIAAALASVDGFVAAPRPAWVRGGVAALSPIAAAAPAAPTGPLVAAAAAARVAQPAQMGLFGLGTPEIAIIAVVGLLVLGPDQVGSRALARATQPPLATALPCSAKPTPGEARAAYLYLPLACLPRRAYLRGGRATDREQVKKLAKDVGKVSAELKQVPEEFNKGVAVGQDELEKKKQMQVSEGAAPAPSPPPTPPPTPPPVA